MNWLSNLDTLKTLSSATQWIAITLVFLGGVLQISKFVIDKRISDLNDNSSKQRDKDYQDTIDKLRTTTQDQVGKLKTVERELRQARSQISTFSARLLVKFSGKWSSPPYPGQILSPVNNEYYVELMGDKEPAAVKFFATEAYAFKTISGNSASFESIQAVKHGDFPLGKTTESLEKFDSVALHIPFLISEKMIDQRVTIENIVLTFLVNGHARHTLTVSNQYTVPLILAGGIGWANPLLKLEPGILRRWLSVD